VQLIRRGLDSQLFATVYFVQMIRGMFPFGLFTVVAL
jgi:hypothetical protein